MIKVKYTLSIPVMPDKGCNFDKLFYYDTHKLKYFPIYAWHGLTVVEVLQKIPNCTYEFWKEGGKTIFLIRIRIATISCIFNPVGICIKAHLFPDR